MKYKLRANISTDPERCLKELLSARGVTEIDEYIHPNKDYELSPYLLDNIKEGAELLIRHLNNEGEILFIVDADVDGVSSSAMLWSYIKDFWPYAHLHYLCHEHKGHGLSDLFDKVDGAGFDLIVLADAGSFDFEFYKKLHEQGTDCLSIDHHDGPGYCEDAIIVNNQLSKKYDNKMLCGAGVVYKFLCVLDDVLNNQRAEYYMDLCALGLISDCMSPAHPENRYYITKGLSAIHNGGFAALIEKQSFSLFRTSQLLTYIKIAFYIAPLINALVRVGTMEEKREMFQSFIEPDMLVQNEKRSAKPGDMVPISTEFARKATNAKARQTRINERATMALEGRVHELGLDDDKILIVPVFEEDEIPQELTGLIAAQLMNKFQRPAMLVRENNEGFMRGSLRGNASFEEVPDFKKFLLDSGLMDYAQGHANAAGVSFKKTQWKALLDYANSHISDEGLNPSYYVDFILKPTDDIKNIIMSLTGDESLWGNDVEEPKIVVENIPLNAKQLFVMGANKDSAKFSDNGVEYIRFKDNNFINEVTDQENSYITVYGTLSRNTFAGRTTAQVIINDYEITNCPKNTYEF